MRLGETNIKPMTVEPRHYPMDVGYEIEKILDRISVKFEIELNSGDLPDKYKIVKALKGKKNEED